MNNQEMTARYVGGREAEGVNGDALREARDGFAAGAGAGYSEAMEELCEALGLTGCYTVRTAVNEFMEEQKTARQAAEAAAVK